MLRLLSQLASLLIFPGFAFLFVCALAFQWIDRKVVARLQGRVGPPWFQPLADFIKLMAKEDVLPVGVHEGVSAALPIVSLATVLTAGLYVPVAGHSVLAFEGDLVGVLFLLSIPALAYFLAGWASISVYSVIGGNRSLLQYFSYEVPLLMALSGPAVMAGSWSISSTCAFQARGTWIALAQPLGFLVAFVGLLGKLRRPPFDIAKAKSEVVAGPLTEFSGRKLALWNLTIHTQTVVGVFLLVNTFLGGCGRYPGAVAGLLFGLKVLIVLLVMAATSVMWARLRIDQMADFGWKVLAPLSLLQMLVTIGIAGG